MNVIALLKTCNYSSLVLTLCISFPFVAAETVNSCIGITEMGSASPTLLRVHTGSSLAELRETYCGEAMTTTYVKNAGGSNVPGLKSFYDIRDPSNH